MEISVKKIQTGDELAFKEFFKEFYPALCVFAASYVVDNSLAADIVQEAFVKLWDKRQNFDSLFKVKSFLYTVVKNSCLNKIRDLKGKRTGLDQVDDRTFFANTMIEEEAYRIFYQAIESLPKQTRKVIELSLDGKKNAEIATELGIQESSVLTLKKHAYQKLRVILREHFYLIHLFLG